MPKLSDLSKFMYSGKSRLKRPQSSSGSDDTSDDMNQNNSSSEPKKPPMLSLLKLPPKLGSSSTTDSTAALTSHDERLWYLKKVYPDTATEEIERVMQITRTLDEAEKLLLPRTCDRAIGKKSANITKSDKRWKRVRLVSDSSNEDVTSPSKSEAPSIAARSSNGRPSADSLQAIHGITARPGGSPRGTLIGRSSSNGLSELPSDYRDAEDDDSASSEEDVVKSKTKRDKVLKFFNEATLEEVLMMPRCKEKKAQLILSLRPFDDWQDLRTKFDGHRVLGPDVLEGCKELIETRQVVLDLMERCERISEQMSSHVNRLTASNDLGTCHIQQQPSLINPKLRLKPYQLIGINWLLLMYQQKVDGILADEMGLGKTSQSIAFLAYLLEQGNKGPHLIIVPASTLDNWGAELGRWCPALKFIVYHGSTQERQELRRQIFYNKETYHIILSTYNVLTSTVDDKQIYKQIVFEYTILDEAHLLKNMTSNRYKNLMKIQSLRRLLLTGTPFQNDLVELMSLLCFVMPQMFINKEDQLKKMFTSISRKMASSGGSEFESERILHAKNIMKPFVLRRLKIDVLNDLPQKTNRVEYVSLCSDQEHAYASVANQHSTSPTDSHMRAVTDLRLAANHHLLLRRKYTEAKLREIARSILTEPTHQECNEQFVYEDMLVMNDYEINNLCKSYNSIKQFCLDDEDILCSGKFRFLDTLLPTIKAQGEKLLIFTQYKLVLDVLEDYLRLRGHSYMRLDGSTKVSDRLSMIEEFNSDDEKFVFVLSTRAGGLGINLTSANHVIIHDMDWNPHNDKQAEDRCHRLGQEREVTVTRLVSKDTVEEAILAQADRKLELEKQIQDGSAADDDTDAARILNNALSLWTTTGHH